MHNELYITDSIKNEISAVGGMWEEKKLKQFRVYFLKKKGDNVLKRKLSTRTSL